MTGRHMIVGLILILAMTFQASAAPVQVIVQLRSSSLLGGVLSFLNGVLLDSIPEANLYLLKLPYLPIVSPLLDYLLGIQWIEPNVGIPLLPMGQVGVLQSRSAGADWYKYQPSMQLIHAQSAATYSTGRGVVVADINSLIDFSHPALRGHLTGGYDFITSRAAGSADLNQASSSFLDQSSPSFLDQSSSSFLEQSSSSFLDNPGAHNPAFSHGTLCAGVIAAVATDAMIMPIRAFDDNGGSDLFTLAKAIRYAATHGAEVINMSFGTLTDSQAIHSAIDFARQNNIVLVASAGNNDTSAPQYPAAYAGVTSVAATNLSDVKSPFSNFGKLVAVDAPGVNIISAYPGGLNSMVSGTSFSAPMVAAEAAMIRSMKSTGITMSITSSAVSVDSRNPQYQGQLGFGRIDVLKAVHP